MVLNRSLLAPAILVGLISACRTPATPPPPPVFVVPVPEQIAYLRRLPSVPVKILTLTPLEWGQLLHAQSVDPVALEKHRARLTAFSLLPLGSSQEGIQEQNVGDVLALYNRNKKTIFAPKTAKPSDPSLLAHEIAHALADHAFDFARFDSIATQDAWDASNALIEGDAMAVLELWRARRSLFSPSVVLAEIARRPVTPGDGSMPAVLRNENEFAYGYGLRFVASLHRIGGWKLVDAAWSKPPWTTEQIYHAEKYLAGEHAIPVARVEAPTTHSHVTSGELGELGIRSVIDTCLPGEGAKVANGWGGDSFHIVRAADGSLGLIWATAWDDEPAAQRFEDSLSRLRACWDEAAKRDRSTGKSALSEGFRIARKGSSVAVVRGFGDGEALVEACFAAVSAKRPPSPPLGPIVSAEGPPFRKPSARMLGRRFDVSEFGFVFDVPPELSAQRMGDVGLFVRDPVDSVFFSVSVAPTSELDEGIRSYIANREEVEKGKAVETGSRGIDTNLGPAHERRWTIGPVRLRTIAIPICGNLRTVFVTSSFVGQFGDARYDQLVGSIHRVGSDTPPACL